MLLTLGGAADLGGCLGCCSIYNVQMDAAVLWNRLPEVTQKSFLGAGSLALQCAFHEMKTQHAFQGFRGSSGGGSAVVCDPNNPRPFARYRLNSSEEDTMKSKSI